MRDASTFDPTRPLAMARFGTLNGFRRHAGAPVTIADEPIRAGEIGTDDAARLWAAGRIVYAEDARPTAVEAPEDAAKRLAILEPLDGDKFLIRAPWLGEGETVTGETAARERLDEVVAAGIETYRSTEAVGGTAAAAAAIGGDTFDLKEDGSNGWYSITGPGLAEPERVRGKANAEARLAEMRGEAARGSVETDAEVVAA